MTELFDRASTGDFSPRLPTESNCAFLLRSDFVVARNIRRVLEDWFGSFPIEGQEDLAERLTSNDDRLFEGAFFELYVHEVIRRCGGTATVHPRLESSSRSPDFLVRETKTPDWFCEAKVVTEISEQRRGRDALRDSLLERLDGIESPDFWLNVSIRGVLKTAPSETKILREVEAWLSDLVWEEFALRQEKVRVLGLPSRSIERGDWKMRIKAMPRSVALRGKKGQRTLGIQSLDGFRPVETRNAVANAIKKKATRYGSLGRPFVLAVSTIQPIGGHEEIRASLYGEGDSSGAFANSSRVSAVFAVSRLVPTTAGSQRPALYRNPFAQYDYDGYLRMFERDEDGHRATREAQRPIGAVLDLPKGWLWREDVV